MEYYLVMIDEVLICVETIGSQNNYAEWKKIDQSKRGQTILLYLYSSRKCKQIYSNRKQITGCLGMGQG
jgi:hypothetical protein